MSKVTCAIVVTYNPEPEKISQCVASLTRQVTQVIVVDNGSTNVDSFSMLAADNIELIVLGENKGIAYAQNYGVQIAKKHHCDYFFFSDQDTVFPDDTVEKLQRIYEQPHAAGQKVGCVSPFFKDLRTNYVHPSVSLNTFTSTKIYTHESGKCLYPSHVIASGMLISEKAWSEVGPFMEELFIDWVDTEWCWRAVSKGFIIVQSPDVMISHELGYGQKNFAGRSVTIHNSFRNYYKIRNALYLMTFSGYSFKYRYHLAFHAIKNIVFEVIYSQNKKHSLKVVMKSVADAFRKKMSKGL